MCTLWVTVATAQIIYDLDNKKDKKEKRNSLKYFWCKIGNNRKESAVCTRWKAGHYKEYRAKEVWFIYWMLLIKMIEDI